MDGNFEYDYKALRTMEIRLRCLELAIKYDKGNSLPPLLCDRYMFYIQTGKWDFKIVQEVNKEK